MAVNLQEEPRDRLAAFAYMKGGRKGEEIDIVRPIVTIGQGADNDVVIADDSVSTRHARLEYANGGWRITDLGSTNGTFAEGVRLAAEVPTPLHHEATLRFGGSELQFRLVEDADVEAARAEYAPPPEPPPIRASRRIRMPLWLAVLIVVLIVLAILFVGWLSTNGGAPDQAAVLEVVREQAPHLLL